jgi:hypothetical protein
LVTGGALQRTSILQRNPVAGRISDKTRLRATPFLRKETVVTGGELAPFIWCVVANVISESHPEGERSELRLGTKHFSPGGKVYCLPISWHDGGERLRVFGRHRGGRRFVVAVVAKKLLTNFRAKQVFDPKLVAQLSDCWDATEECRTKTEAMARALAGC